jgi:hypothetical protein
MDRTRNRWMLRFAVILVAGVGMLVWSFRQRGESMLIIANQSGQVIVDLTVTAGDQSLTLRNILPDSEVSVPFVTRGDTQFKLRGNLAGNLIIRYDGKVERLKMLILPGGMIQVPTTKS